MKAGVNRRTVDLSGFPDLVVIYLGMRVNALTGVKTLMGFGPKIARSVEARPEGLLPHEGFLFWLFPPHVGMRQYWQQELYIVARRWRARRTGSRSMKLNPYLAFDGRCREAFEFYEKTLGGKIAFIQTMGESPMASGIPPDAHGRVMHVTLQVGDQVLQGADTPSGQFSKPAGFCVALHFDGTAEGERVFNALAQDGKVQMPFQPTLWAKGFGMLIDRFGTPWIVKAGQTVGS